MHQPAGLFLAIFLLSASAAADVSDSVIGKTAATGAAAGIDWFDGTVDQAFATARGSEKPLFLYWGAEWCPPCHAINNTVFRSPAFIERSRLFVPVYLDGDTPLAQAAGERFGVRGYPTMIVFGADGEELTRIPGGIDIQAYSNVLDLTLTRSAATSEVVRRLLDEGGALSATECTQFAYYSWRQDGKILSDRDEMDAFRTMYEACPGELDAERSILYLAWLQARLDDLAASEEDADTDAPPAPLEDATRHEARQAVNRILGDDRLVRANVLVLLFSGARITAAISEPDSPERAQLTRKFMAAYNDLYADDGLYKRERIYTLQGKIGFARIEDEDATIPDDLRQEIRAVVEWADESTPDPYERQPIINALGNVLESAGMDDDARKLLLAELGISRQPYYFMPTLADIEQRAGNDEAALEWLQKGWDTSTGPATRFQWGSYYLDGLLEMRPEARDQIEATTLTLVRELQSGGGFYNRSTRLLERMEEKLRAWSVESDASDTLDAIRASVATACAADPLPESRAICESFLDAA